MIVLRVVVTFAFLVAAFGWGWRCGQRERKW